MPSKANRKHRNLNASSAKEAGLSPSLQIKKSKAQGYPHKQVFKKPS